MKYFHHGSGAGVPRLPSRSFVKKGGQIRRAASQIVPPVNEFQRPAWNDLLRAEARHAQQAGPDSSKPPVRRPRQREIGVDRDRGLAVLETRAFGPSLAQA